MQRNYDVIRNILLYVEENEDDICGSLTEDNKEEYIYHINLLKEQGFLKGKVIKLSEGDRCIVDSLTWEGHELLDAIRSDTIWKKTKLLLKEKGLGITSEIVKKVAMKLTEEMI